MIEKQLKDLTDLINKDSYHLSIGEILNLYRDKELELIKPKEEITLEQKTVVIEAILLGLDCPNIVVRVEDDGTWKALSENIELSTIIEFIENPFKLKSCRLLKLFEDQSWETFTANLRMNFKRKKVYVQIIHTNLEIINFF